LVFGPGDAAKTILENALREKAQRARRNGSLEDLRPLVFGPANTAKTILKNALRGKAQRARRNGSLGKSSQGGT